MSQFRRTARGLFSIALVGMGVLLYGIGCSDKTAECEADAAAEVVSDAVGMSEDATQADLPGDATATEE